jgi:hypothetical protein
MSIESGANALEVLEPVAYNGSMSLKNGDKLLCFIIGELVTDDHQVSGIKIPGYPIDDKIRHLA